MNLKELQEEYINKHNNAKTIIETERSLNLHYIRHVHSQSVILSKLLNKSSGLHYMKDALKEWPSELANEIQKLNDINFNK